jgi:hypothetical protein
MGRLFSWSGCYGVQESGDANDGEEWSCIDEGRWKERGREEDRRLWWGDGWGKGREKGGRQTEREIDRGGCLFLKGTWLVVEIFPLR